MTDTNSDLTVIAADAVAGDDRETCLSAAVRRISEPGSVSDPESVTEALLERERIAPTDFGEGIALPHAETEAVEAPLVAIVRLDSPVQFSEDGYPVSLLVIVLVPADDAASHRPVLSAVARTLLDDDLSGSLVGAVDAEALRARFEAALHH